MKNYRAQTPQNLAVTKILKNLRKTSLGGSIFAVRLHFCSPIWTSIFVSAKNFIPSVLDQFSLLLDKLNCNTCPGDGGVAVCARSAEILQNFSGTKFCGECTP